MKAELQADLKEEFDNDMADAVKLITFKSYTNTYNLDSGDNTQVAADVITRGLVNGYTEREVAKSDGTIKIDDKRVLIISSEIEREPLINDICDVDGLGEYKIAAFAPDAFGASYVIRMSKENG